MRVVFPRQQSQPCSASHHSVHDHYAYLHCSDIRTTYPQHDTNTTDCCMDKSLDVQCRSLADLAIDSSPSSQPCEECVQECEEEDCEVELTEQCTDQCVVVPCNDAHHEAAQPEAATTCDFMCVDGPDCTAIEHLLQCCQGVDYHQLFQDSKSLPGTSMPHASTQWPVFTDPMFQNYMTAAPSQSSSLQNSLYYTDSTASTPQLAASPAHSYAVTTPRSEMSPAPQSQMSVSNTEQTQHRCMWADCGAIFASMNELVGHVNLQHLRLPPMPDVAPQAPAQVQPQQPTYSQPYIDNSSQQPIGTQNPDGQLDASSLACLWADCRVYPTPSSIPGPSMGDQTNNIIGFLASHLMQDHLGLTGPSAPQITRTPSPSSTSTRPHSQNRDQRPATTVTTKLAPLTPPPTSRASSPSLASPPTPAPEHDCKSPEAHVCRWRGCGETFSSCDALTTHITGVHVGGGKAYYECFWEGCKRNSESGGGEKGEKTAGGEEGAGAGGFTSKQKICRHLQSHTGHRPFQCKVCKQNFSEAATLAQHMRRHTQEKPYVCDFPGCGKSFAITGALTIHKRTHNGHKPFKCTFCERAFTESSNLSKHLRTHTGVRPYACTEPECTKTFARPDQLARHMTVHKKKLGGGAVKGRRSEEAVERAHLATEVEAKA